MKDKTKRHSNPFFRLSIAIIVISASMLSIEARSQQLGELLNNVGTGYGSMYTTPLTNSLGADMNSGLFHTAKSAKGLLGINVYVGVKFAGMMVNTQDQYFDLAFQSVVDFDYRIGNSHYDLSVPAQFEVDNAPTIFGERTAATATANVRFDTTLVYNGNDVAVTIDTTFSQDLIGGIWKTAVAPIVIPHASFGSVLGTDFVVRWLPEISHADYGRVKLRGFGIRHNVSRYLPSLPVDVGVSAVWQRLETSSTAAGNFNMNVNTLAYNVIVSKELLLVTVYGALQREKATVDYSYELTQLDELTGESIDVAFSHRASLQNRAVVGVTLNLGPFITNVDFSMGEERVATAGIGFGF